MSTLKVATIQDTSGNNSSTPSEVNNGRAKAWCNFNGTGTVAIRDSYNISSLTDRGTGQYTLSFTTAMANSNYASVFGANAQAAGYAGVDTQNTGTLLCYGSVSGSFNDASIVNVAIFGD